MSEPHPLSAQILDLRPPPLRDARIEAIAQGVLDLEIALAKFQRASGCVDGPTLGDALARIMSILRDDEEWPSPIEGIPDVAARVVVERNRLREETTKAVALEREACAKVADEEAATVRDERPAAVARDIAALIRARKEML